jgi:hypothetical protein
MTSRTQLLRSLPSVVLRELVVPAEMLAHQETLQRVLVLQLAPAVLVVLVARPPLPPLPPFLPLAVRLPVTTESTMTPELSPARPPI